MTQSTMYTILAIMGALTLISLSSTFHIRRKALIQRKLVEHLQRQITCNDAELKAHVDTLNIFEWFIRDLIEKKDDTLATQFKLNNLAAARTILDMQGSMCGRYQDIHEILTSTCPEDIVEDMRKLLNKYYAYDTDTRDCVRLMVYTAKNAYDDFNGMDERRKRVFRQFLRELEYEGIRVNHDVKLRGRFSGNEPLTIDPVVKKPTLWEIKEEIDKLVESGAINLSENGVRNNAEDMEVSVPVVVSPHEAADGEATIQAAEGNTEIPIANLQREDEEDSSKISGADTVKEVTPDNIGITTIVASA